MNEVETGVDILDPRFHGDDGLGRFYAPIILHAMVVIKLDIFPELIDGKDEWGKRKSEAKGRMITCFHQGTQPD